MNCASDSELWEVLEMCHMKEAVVSAGGLSGTVREGGESLSQGQRQLLCLARSLLGTARVSHHIRPLAPPLKLGTFFEHVLWCLQVLIDCSNSLQILFLDECTANVDPQTTELLKKTVAKECANMTVIIIAHRISTIIDLHRVMIMEQGRLVSISSEIRDIFFEVAEQLKLVLVELSRGGGRL